MLSRVAHEREFGALILVILLRNCDFFIAHANILYVPDIEMLLCSGCFCGMTCCAISLPLVRLPA